MSTKEELVEFGKKEARQGNFESAIDFFQKALAKDPKFADAHFYLAGVYLKTGDRKAARKALRSVLVIQPEHARAASLLEQLSGGSQGRSRLHLPRLLGVVGLCVILLALLVAYTLAFFHLDSVTAAYGQLLGNLYHSMDVEDPFTGHWQPWRVITGILVVVFVVGTLILATFGISYAVSCPLYAIRYDRWSLQMVSLTQLGTGASTLVYTLVAPLLILLVIILTRLWGAKFLVLAGVIALLGVFQFLNMREQEQVRRRQ